MTYNNSKLGSWVLTRWSCLWGVDLPLSEDDPGHKWVADFLYQETMPELSASVGSAEITNTLLARTQARQADIAQETSGSMLTLLDDGTYKQSGTGMPPVLSFDNEGVQVSGVAEFNGILLSEGSKTYLLRTGFPSWAIPRVIDRRLRWDDGDTKICDFVELINGELARTMFVVTDEMYGDCVVLIYKRS